jgi:hypothetical protein
MTTISSTRVNQECFLEKENTEQIEEDFIDIVNIVYWYFTILSNKMQKYQQYGDILNGSIIDLLFCLKIIEYEFCSFS